MKLCHMPQQCLNIMISHWINFNFTNNHEYIEHKNLSAKEKRERR